jgi:acyl carrier protein
MTNSFKMLQKILSNTLGIPENDINLNSSMKNINKWDSMAQIKIILELEKRIDKINSSELVNLTSIKEIIKYLDKHS